jgi:hypothetical protein
MVLILSQSIKHLLRRRLNIQTCLLLFFASVRHCLKVYGTVTKQHIPLLVLHMFSIPYSGPYFASESLVHEVLLNRILNFSPCLKENNSSPTDDQGK